MKILFVSPKADGLWFVWRLRDNGHEVDWLLEDKKYAEIYQGIIPPPLPRFPDVFPYDLVVFDLDGMGEVADYCNMVTPTIGSSTLADRLEEDRLFGLEVMERCGIRVPAYEVFDSREKGIAWLAKTHKRCVFKPIGEV